MTDGAEGTIIISEAYYHALIDSLPLQVWTALPDGKLDYVNKQVCDYFQKNSDQMIGEGWQHVIHPDDLPIVVEKWTHSLKTLEDYQVEFRLKDGKDGQYRYYIGRAIPFKDKDGKIIKWFGANSDINEYKLSEAKSAEHANDLEKLNNLMVGRELKMVDMKNELEALRDQLEKNSTNS